ncbi:sugar O-acetyltransferase [Corynebacterium mastitidis]|uniref:Acetyltransferase n=1 Tax=Corynebacterium mastitidis TaxID=161890 RepID=A0A2N0X4W2_9CORY|nr:DapH/DapD/GlmU-related protein [Corynebacterium mastitidis]MCH6197817.1 sugar O-acetyltransferase [Corynebacterium mastitidis]PKF67738.1 acetyltransferase [Corynebacterium mastitidis]
MSLEELLEFLDTGATLKPGSPEWEAMNRYADQARDVCARLSTAGSDLGLVRECFSTLTGRDVPETLRVFPPFTADFGKNIHLGEDVFINSGCRFQDQGGITLGDRVLIGHNVVIATLHHGMAPGDRAHLEPRPVRIASDVWIGAGAIILPGVSVGEHAVVGAGSVVTRDVPARTVVAGNPARPIRSL